MSEPVRLGLVGCGRLAEQAYVPAAATLDGVELAGVADPDPYRRRQVADLADRAGARPMAFEDAAGLVEGARLDAVVLASPAAAHLEDARLASAAGLPVLVEKPPAPDGSGAAALADLDPPVRIGFNRRFDPGVRGVRSALPADRPVDLRLRLHYRRRSWAPHQVADDVRTDLGPHLVDLARWLTGSEVRAVDGVAERDGALAFDLVLDRGIAHVDVSSDRLHDERVEALTPDGHLLARHRAGGRLGAVTGRLRRGPHPLVTSITAQLAAFAEHARGRAAPDLATAHDGHAVMAILDAVARGGGRPAPLADDAHERS